MMKTIPIYTLILLYIFINTGCNRFRKNSALPKKSDRSATISFEDFNLPFDSTNTRALYYAQGFENKTYILNTTTQEILIYQPLQCRFIGSIRLPDSILHPDSLHEITSFYIQSPDSIFILQEFQLSLLNRTGHQIAKWPLNTDTSAPFYYYKLSGNFPISYSPQKDVVFVERFSTAYGQDVSQRFNHGVEAGIHLSSSRIDTSPVTFPSIYRSGYYGFADDEECCVNGDLHIYSFMLDPNLYIWNTISNVVEVRPGKSVYQKHEPEPIDVKYKDSSELKMEKMLTYPVYFNLLYDPYRKVYYRFFYKDKPFKNDDGTYNSWADKGLVLMIFDTDFNLILEQNLTKNKYGSLAFVNSDGLWLSRLHYKNPVRNISNIIPLTLIALHEK